MLNIEDLLELDKAFELTKRWAKRLDTAKSEYRDLQKLETSPANLETLLARKQGEIDRLTQGYEEAQTTFETLSEQKGIDGFADFEYDVKRKFLGELISQSHISEMAEEPSAFFHKLIQLYGEDGLANFSYDIGADGREVELDDREYAYDDDMEYDDDDMQYDDDMGYDNEPFWKKHISDFIYGEEDKIIGLVRTDKLRTALLGSKLMFIHTNGEGNTYECFDEYVEKAKEYNTYDCAYFDDLGYIDYEDTLNNFGMLPISDDKNFYLYLLKHKLIPSGTLMKYIKKPLLKDADFVLDMQTVDSTGEHNYNPDYAYSPDVFRVLAQKEATLTKLESEAEKISQAEALIDEQQKGQGKGE